MAADGDAEQNDSPHDSPMALSIQRHQYSMSKRENEQIASKTVYTLSDVTKDPCLEGKKWETLSQDVKTSVKTKWLIVGQKPMNQDVQSVIVSYNDRPECLLLVIGNNVNNKTFKLTKFQRFSDSQTLKDLIQQSSSKKLRYKDYSTEATKRLKEVLTKEAGYLQILDKYVGLSKSTLGLSDDISLVSLKNALKLLQYEEIIEITYALIQQKQPRGLKHFSAISLLDQIKMLTDGHQDSERIAHLFNVLISLAPAIILPQQSEIVLSYVKMNDILLSLLDPFSEETTRALCRYYVTKLNQVWYSLNQLKPNIVHRKVMTDGFLQNEPFQSLSHIQNDLFSSTLLSAAVQPLNASLCGQLMTFSGGGDKDPMKGTAPKLAKKDKPNNEPPDPGRDINQPDPCARPVEESGGIEKFHVTPDASDSDSQTDPPEGTPPIPDTPSKSTCTSLSATPPDVNPSNATPPDANPSNATPPDVNPSNATPPDANPSNATPPDVNPSNATSPDANPLNTSLSDANPSNATPPDANPSNATPPDANPLNTSLSDVDPLNATSAGVNPSKTTSEATAFEIASKTCVPENTTHKSTPVLTLPADSALPELCVPHEAASVGTSSSDRAAKNDISNELSDILSSACEQYEAMNYGEMAYMLSKSSHLARTHYESAVLSFAQGLAAFVQNKNEEAIDHFQEALSIFEGLRTNDTYLNDIIKCLEMMAKSERSQGHYRSASEYFERILSAHQHHQSSTLEELLKLERTSLSSILSDYAMCLRSEDRVVDSERYYRRAVSCPDATPTDRISALTGLGNLLHSVGSNDKAVTEYIAAIELAEKEEEYLSLAWAHGNLGNTYLSLGRKEKGLSHLQTSLNLTLDHDPDPSSISRALNNLGTAYQSLNELDKAELYFDQALSQAIYANDHIGQARAYGNIGNVYMLLKDFLKAIPHYTEVLRLSRDRSTVYVAYHNRGCALFELAEKKKGEQYHFMKRGEFQFIAIGPDTGDMEYKHQPEEEMEEHTTELYQQGLKDLRKVIKNVESAFSNASATTVGLDLYLSLFHINAKTFQRAQDCAFNLRDHYLSLTIAEQARARTLGELLLKRKSHQLPTSFTTPLNIDQIKLAVELLPDPYTPVVVLSYTGTRLLVWVLVFDGKMVSINSFEQEPDDELFGKSLDMYLRYELAEELTGNIDLYGEEKEKEEVTIEEVEKREEDKEKEDDEKAKLDSIHEKKESDDDSSKATFDENKFTDSNFLDANKLEKSLTESVKQEKKKAISGPAAKRWILSSLYKMISKPLEAILKAVIPESILQSRGPHKIILIPDNTTKMIPFNALLDEEGGSYFGDKYVLQFFPSVLSLGIMSQAPPTIIRIREHTTEDVLIVGDPSTPSFNFEGEDWTPGPLPHAKKEAEWVGHYLGTPPLLGEEPTKEVIKSRLSQSKLIHLATHGSASHGFVVLAGHCYNRQSTLPTSYRYTEDQDKLLLYSSEIESLCLRSPLVILSSCDSGRGRFKGDEIQGMSRSFLLAGAAAVMTSLWKVPDQSASYFMQFFYRYLLDGHTSSVALQKSIQSIRSIHHFSQVIHWGGYQLTGSDVKIVVDVSDEDEKVLKALGCSGGSSPFPRLELLQQLETNLLSPDERHVQILYGPCGTDPIETVKDFIAKHHDAYKGIYWCNAVHCNVMNETVKMMQKFCGIGDGSGQSVLLVIDSATVDSLSCLTSLPPFIDVILIADSLAEYNELSKQVDEKLKRRVRQLPTIKPLTDLESTQRIVYSINNEEDLELHSEDISEVAVSCSGSPSLVSVAVPLIKELKSLQEFEKELQAELRSLEEIKKQHCASLRIIECLPITPSSRIFLNCASVFRGVPIPKPFLVSLENEILDASVSSSPSSSSFFSSTSSPVSSLSCSSSSSFRPLSCIAELIKWNCLKHYPTPIVIQSSAKASSPLNMTLFTVPGIISESIWNNMDNEEKLFAIGVAYRTIKKKASQLSGYSHSLICQLLERYEDIEDSNGETEQCFIHLLSLKELF